MADLLDIIKKAGIQGVSAGNPVNILTGEVKSINPLSVSVDQRFILDADFLVVPERLTRYEIDLKHFHYYPEGTNSEKTETALNDKIVIRTGLAVSNKVLLIRVQGGQKYVILDKVVEL